MQKTRLKNRLIGNCRDRTPNASEWVNCWRDSSSCVHPSTHHSSYARQPSTIRLLLRHPQPVRLASSSNLLVHPFALCVHPGLLTQPSQTCLLHPIHSELFPTHLTGIMHGYHLRYYSSYHVTIHGKIYTVVFYVGIWPPTCNVATMSSTISSIPEFGTLDIWDMVLNGAMLAVKL